MGKTSSTTYFVPGDGPESACAPPGTGSGAGLRMGTGGLRMTDGALLGREPPPLIMDTPAWTFGYPTYPEFSWFSCRPDDDALSASLLRAGITSLLLFRFRLPPFLFFPGIRQSIFLLYLDGPTPPSPPSTFVFFPCLIFPLAAVDVPVYNKYILDTILHRACPTNLFLQLYILDTILHRACPTNLFLQLFCYLSRRFQLGGRYRGRFR